MQFSDIQAARSCRSTTQCSAIRISATTSSATKRPPFSRRAGTRGRPVASGSAPRRAVRAQPISSPVCWTRSWTACRSSRSRVKCARPSWGPTASKKPTSARSPSRSPSTTCLVRNPGDIPAAIAEAFALARSGRPGAGARRHPDRCVQGGDARESRARRRIAGCSPTSHPIAAAIDAAIELLRAAKQPVLIAGGGIRHPDAVAAFRRFAALVGAPQTTTHQRLRRRRGGRLARHGHAGHARHESRQSRGPRERRVLRARHALRRPGHWAHGPLRPRCQGRARRHRLRANSTRSLPPKSRCAATSPPTLVALADELERHPAPRFDDWAREATGSLDGTCRRDRVAAHQLSATTVLDRFFEVMPSNAIVTTDVGQHQMWAAQRIRPREPRAFATSAGSGFDGLRLPGRHRRAGRPSRAAGVRYRRRRRLSNVAGRTGDAASAISLPVKIVLIDNRNLGMVRQWQELFYDERYSATNLSDNPDFAAIAAAYGIRSETVDAVGRSRGRLRSADRDPGAGAAALRVLPGRERLADDSRRRFDRRRDDRPFAGAGMTTIDATVNDPRLVARIVNLAERCGCRYRSISRRIQRRPRDPYPLRVCRRSPNPCAASRRRSRASSPSTASPNRAYRSGRRLSFGPALSFRRRSAGGG